MLNFKIREADADDFDMVLDCVKDVYGRLYPQKEIYSRDYFMKALKEGHMAFFIAITDDDDAAGVIGVSSKPFFSRPGYLVTQAVKHNYRRNGVGRKLMERAIGYLIENGHTAVYGNCVTAHTMSQHEMEKLGFKCTGFLPGIRDGSKLPHGGSSKKTTLCLLVLNCGKNEAGTIYIPPELEQTAKKTYERVRSSCRIETAEGQPAEQSSIETYYDCHHGTVYMHITNCGTDLGQYVSAIEAEYSKSPVCTAFIYLNIKDASAITGYRELSRLGYIFSGFKPLYYDFEYILMFKGINTSVEFSETRLIDGYGEVFEEVLGAYVRQVD